jgi:hypothetical protein
MAREPRPLLRPVLILAGWHSPGIAGYGIEGTLKPSTSGRDQDFLSVSYPLSRSFESAAAKVAQAMTRRGLNDAEVDIVGISMGGLVARALINGAFGPAVRAARLFTIATPHRGAKLANVACPDAAARDMRARSQFLCGLDAAPCNTKLICYGIVRDWWVGATNTSPHGTTPYWLEPIGVIPRLFAHFAINFDTRVLADIARRLRGETPLTKEASAPPTD